MPRQTDISFPMRSIVVDWLATVMVEYRLQEETLHLAVSHLDRFLSVMSVRREKLQLVATTCLFIAAKYEEANPPQIGEFVYITDDAYTEGHVRRMEQRVFLTLGFNVSPPTALYFAKLLCRAAGIDGAAAHLTQYLVELSLLDGESFLYFTPSQVAASAVTVALHALHQPVVWPAACAELTGMDIEDFEECAAEVHRMHEASAAYPLQTIRQKYMASRYVRELGRRDAWFCNLT